MPAEGVPAVGVPAVGVLTTDAPAVGVARRLAVEVAAAPAVEEVEDDALQAGDGDGASDAEDPGRLVGMVGAGMTISAADGASGAPLPSPGSIFRSDGHSMRCW